MGDNPDRGPLASPSLAVPRARRSLPAMFAHRRVTVSRRVLVNLKTGRAISGVLVKATGPLLVVKQAHLLEEDRPPVPLDGEIVVERSNVDFIQALAPLEV